MEFTALSVGKSVLSGALGYAKSAVAAEVALQLGVQRDQAFITDELEMMQAFLMAAHDEADDNRVVKTWVKQVSDVAYDVEDSLQDFAVRLHKQSWWHIPRTLLDRRHVAKEMKDLRAKVEDVSQRNARYRLIRGSGSKPPTAGGQKIISTEVILHIAEAAREALLEKKKVDLVQLMTEDDENELRSIAVWGASSDVGVTSIIRAAYDNKHVKDKFQCRAWVRLVHPFNPNDFFVSLVRQFYGDQPEESGKATKGSAVGLEVLKKMAAQANLVDEFNRYVTEKKYLVVFTDVSTIEEWDWIKTYFPSRNGSRIILSTQQFEVASLCTEQPYTVSEIDQKWSFDKDFYVFYKKVDAPTKGDDKPESSSKDEISGAESAAGVEHAEKTTRADKVAASAFEEDQLIDRAAAKAEVVRLIDLDGEVVTICGMGGLGKTTLARSVYQQELAEKFQRRAWLTISGSFNPEEFLGNLFRQLQIAGNDKLQSYAEDKEETGAPDSKKKKETEEEKLLTNLAKILREQRCLIVLDDLPSIVEWQLITQLLPSPRNSASRILVTTRQLSVARHCCLGQNKIYDLALLTKTEAMDLFQKKVFKDVNERENFRNTPSLIEQANLILKKCDGLPLAISTICSFLATKPKTTMEWIYLNKHISAELQMNPELGMIKTVIASSYDGLPYRLKCPFLYLAIFPEDHGIRWTRLVRRWIAEGYSTGIRNRTAEESGTSNITELINRNMVRPSKGTSRRSGRAGFLQVHDLIREIVVSKATEENLVFTLEDGSNLNTQGKIRHLAVSSNWTRDKKAFETAVDLSHLRSLTVFGGLESYFISDKMRLLRVLDLEDANGLTDDHLHQIGEFVHLNYLSLRRCDGILRLPNSIGNLTHLHTLDIRDTCIINLPRTIIKLPELRYLRVGYVPAHDEEEVGAFDPVSPLSYLSYWTQEYLKLVLCCCFPAWLLVGLAYLLSLPGLFIWVLWRDGLGGQPESILGLNPRGVKLPRGVRKLKALHTMGTVNIDGAKAILEDLRHLTLLRKLRVTGLNKKNSRGFFSAIARHKCLESLLVRAEGRPGLSGCLDDVSSPPVNLQSLKLYGNLGTLPQWIQGMGNLVKMELRSSRIPEVAATLQILGKLPILAILRLRTKSFKGKKVCFNFPGDTFPSLMVLEMDLPAHRVSVVGFEQGATPKLEQISFNFRSYIFYPSSVSFSGLPSLLSLKELVLRGNRVLEYKDVTGLRAQLAMNPNHPVLKRE